MESGGPTPPAAGFPTFEAPGGESKPAEPPTEAAGSTPPPADSAPPPPGDSSTPGQSPMDAQLAGDDPFAERPEVYVGAAFAGGLAVALILRRLGR